MQRFAAVPFAQLEETQCAEGCAICMSEYHEEEQIVRMQRCPHVFHKDCLKQWFIKSQQEPTCPFCREQLA